MTTLHGNDVMVRSDVQVTSGSMGGQELEGIQEIERQEAARVAWRSAVDRLLEWWKDPDRLQDEDADAPGREILEAAIRLARHLELRRMPPPGRVVPTSEGGVAFERWSEETAEILELLPDGSAELRGFKHDRLAYRVPAASWVSKA